MAYVIPTAADLKARFPEFAAVADGRVSAVIGEASAFVDETWLERDYKPAIQFLAAHMLVGEGVLAPAQLAGAGISPTAVSGAVSNVSVGDVSVGFASGGSASSGGSGGVGSDAWLASTPYGQRFLALRKRNVMPVAVV